jgi:hypothetical protein
MLAHDVFTAPLKKRVGRAIWFMARCNYHKLITARLRGKANN